MAMQRLDFGGIQGAIGRYAENIRRRNELIAEQQRRSEEKAEEENRYNRRLAAQRLYNEGIKTKDRQVEVADRDDANALQKQRETTNDYQRVAEDNREYFDKNEATRFGMDPSWISQMERLREGTLAESARKRADEAAKKPTGGGGVAGGTTGATGTTGKGKSLTDYQMMGEENAILELHSQFNQLKSSHAERFPVSFGKGGKSVIPKSVVIDEKGTTLNRSDVEARLKSLNDQIEYRTKRLEALKTHGGGAGGQPGGEPGGQPGGQPGGNEDQTWLESLDEEDRAAAEEAIAKGYTVTELRAAAGR